MAIALVLSAVLAVVRVLKVPVLDRLVAVFISFFRGTPLLVQLFLFYYGLPQVVAALPRDRRRNRRRRRPDAALLRLHGREHPRRDPRHRPQPVGGRRRRRHDPAAADAPDHPAAGRPRRGADPAQLLHRHDQEHLARLHPRRHRDDGRGAEGGRRQLPLLRGLPRRRAASTGPSSRRCPSCSAGWRRASAGPSRDDPRRGPNQAVRRPHRARRHRPRRSPPASASSSSDRRAPASRPCCAA